MPIERFSQHMAMVSGGVLDDELTDVIHKAVKEVSLNGGKYEINLKIRITGKEIKDAFFVEILPTYTTKHTPVDVGGSSYPCQANGQLDFPDNDP